MDDHRHTDQDPVFRYPMHRMVAILDDEAAVQVALGELARVGIEPSEVVVLSGEEGVALLDPRGERHGLTGRLLRLAQWTAEEGDELEIHREALAAGKRVVYVPTHGRHQRDEVAAALTAAGGHHLAYFGRWTVEKTVETE